MTYPTGLNALRRRFGHASRPRTRKTTRRALPWLEALEGRVVLATLTWKPVIVSFDQNWSVADRWDNGSAPDRAPVDGDDLVFPQNGGILGAFEPNNNISGLSLNSVSFQGQGSAGNDYNLTGNRFTLASGGTISASNGADPEIVNNITLGGTAAKRFVVGTDSVLALRGILTGTGGLTKEGSGTLSIRALLNTYTGRTTAAAGQVFISSANGLGESGTANDTVVLPGAALNVASFTTAVSETLGLAGTLRVAIGTWSGPITFLVNDAVISTSDDTSGIPIFALTGTLGGVGGLLKAGTGTLRLTGSAAIDYTGRTFVSAGTLELDKSSGVTLGGTLDIGNPNGSSGVDRVRLLRSNQIADTAAVNVRKSGELNLQGFADAIGPLSMVGGKIVASGDGERRGLLIPTSSVTTAGGGRLGNGNVVPEITSRVGLGTSSHIWTVNAADGISGLNLSSGLEADSGSGRLVKRGDGGLRLGGQRSLGRNGGGVIVEAGTVTVAGEYGGDENNRGTDFRVTGGMLEGRGTIGRLVAIGGTVRPGFQSGFVTLGVLTAQDVVSFGSNATFAFSSRTLSTNVIQNSSLRVVRSDVNLAPAAVTLGNATLVNVDPVASTPGIPFTVIDVNDILGTVSGRFRVRGQVIDGVVDAVENPAFTFSPNNQASLGLFLSYPTVAGQDLSLTNNGSAARDLAVTPPTATEGQEVALTGTLFGGAVAAGRLFLSIDWGDGSSSEQHEPGREAFRFTHRYADNPRGGTYTVTARWFDEFGFGNTRLLTVAVNNAPPVIISLAAGAAGTAEPRVRGRVKLTARFLDPGTRDTHTAAIDWGDGRTSRRQVTRKSGGVGQVAAGHRYRQPGVYTVTLTLRDDDAGTTVRTVKVLVTARLSQRGHPGGAHGVPPLKLTDASVRLGEPDPDGVQDRGRRRPGRDLVTESR